MGGVPEPPPHDGAAYPRVAFLIRIESLINVGCKFSPHDLDAKVWDELIALSIERAYVERVLDKRREKHRETEVEQNKARTATGVPPPGGTIFPSKHKF